MVLKRIGWRKMTLQTNAFFPSAILGHDAETNPVITASNELLVFQ
jgi:hypothetical protein